MPALQVNLRPRQWPTSHMYHVRKVKHISTDQVVWSSNGYDKAKSKAQRATIQTLPDSGSSSYALRVDRNTAMRWHETSKSVSGNLDNASCNAPSETFTCNVGHIQEGKINWKRLLSYKINSKLLTNRRIEYAMQNNAINSTKICFTSQLIKQGALPLFHCVYVLIQNCCLIRKLQHFEGGNHLMSSLQ